MKLEGKVAVVTGAARGLGAEIAVAMAREGARVAALDICRDIESVHALSVPAALQEVVTAVERAGSEAVGLSADVRSTADCERAVQRVVETWGRIDILCNNAGVCVVQPVDEITDDTLNAIIDVNVKGSFNMVRQVSPVMKDQRYGKIINISSAGSIKTVPHVSAYAASKGAINVATRSWAGELAEWDINVNSVAPGTLNTPMIAGLGVQQGIDSSQAFEQFNVNNLFVGDRGNVTPGDVATMTVFLASEDARTITGQLIAVDAGFSS